MRLTAAEKVEVMRLAGGLTFQSPNRFIGTGTLALTTHAAARAARRMVGTVTANVTGPDGESVSLVVDFGANMSCGVGPL